MRIVSDSSAFLAVVLSEPERSAIVQSTQGTEVCAPDILPYEIGNALTAMVKRDRLDGNQALKAWRSFSEIPVRLLTAEIAPCLELACCQNIYAYDAYFLHITQKLSCPLLTLDKRMRQVAIDLGIEIMEV